MTKTRFVHKLPFGATLSDDGETTRFRIWAPSVPSIRLVLDSVAEYPMQGTGGGWHELVTEATAGTRYRYLLPDGLVVPDPGSRRQDGDVHGWSVVVDPTAHEWHSVTWTGRPWHEAIVYELHAGAMGGFDGIGDALPGLAELGITAIEMMPIADFPGRRNWGYDGVLPYAPDEAYGTIGELKTLIDKAHGHGLMMLLDVVYNHFGPDGAYLHVYAREFFDEAKHTPWGAAIDFHRPEVREYFIENAIYWLNEYRFDGLRFDAVHAIEDETFLHDLARAIRTRIEPGRQVCLVLEHGGNKASLLGGGNRFDAQWADDAHHCWHVLLTGEHEGYYADYTDAAALLAKALSEGFAYQGQKSPRGRIRGEPSASLPSDAFVFCLQNHDQIGNRAFGERLTQLADPEALRAAAAMLLLAPEIPMLFMGEEYGARAPFLYFTDHTPELAKLVRDGRRKEFAHFAAFADPNRREQIPDPNAPATFELSIPDRADADPRTEAHYRILLGIRHRHIIPRLPGTTSLGAAPVGDTGVLARWTMGDGAELIIASNVGGQPLQMDAVDAPMLFESRGGDADSVRNGRLPARCTVAFMQEPM
ncbi:MAG TPA: malto-oligosyltrehalose trehalohydrolase [Acetobacteraceae bacterium]|nr:malto-oligosyltrehalose trehalohydrolase [Acetobacteraceae bacterium]